MAKMGRPRVYSKLGRREIALTIKKYGYVAGKQALRALGLNPSNFTIQVALEEFGIKLVSGRGMKRANPAYFLS